LLTKKMTTPPIVSRSAKRPFRMTVIWKAR